MIPKACPQCGNTNRLYLRVHESEAYNITWYHGKPTFEQVKNSLNGERTDLHCDDCDYEERDIYEKYELADGNWETI